MNVYIPRLLAILIMSISISALANPCDEGGIGGTGVDLYNGIGGTGKEVSRGIGGTGQEANSGIGGTGLQADSGIGGTGKEVTAVLVVQVFQPKMAALAVQVCKRMQASAARVLLVSLPGSVAFVSMALK